MSGLRARGLGPAAAVAALAAREATRAAWVRAVAVALVLGPAVIAATSSGDGSAVGRLRAFVSWSVDLVGVCLTLTAVFLAAGLASRLRRGELTQLACGPLGRVGLVAGWSGGVAAVGAGLAAIALVTVGLGAAALAARADPADRPALRQALTAWARVEPRPPDPAAVAAAVAARLSDLRRTGQAPADGEGGDDLARALEAEVRLGLRSVRPGQTIGWTFSGVRPGPEVRELTLRFRFDVDEARETGRVTQREIPGRFWFRAPGSQEASSLDGTWRGGRPVELRAPVEVLEGSHEVELLFTSRAPPGSTVVFPREGPRLIHEAGGLASNALRAGLLLAARVGFLAAVTAVAAALLDANLAALAGLFALFLGAAHGFLADALVPGTFGLLDGPLRGLASAALAAGADLSRVDVADALATGQAIPWAEVGRAVGLDLVLRGGLALSVGGALFARRELGALR